MTLLALIIGGWLVLGILAVTVLNVAKWLVRSASASAPAPRVVAPERQWPAPHRSVPVSHALPQPYVGGAVVARRSGIGSRPTG